MSFCFSNDQIIQSSSHRTLLFCSLLLFIIVVYLIRSLQYGNIVWNYVTRTRCLLAWSHSVDCAAVCYHHFSTLPFYTSAETLHSLKLHKLRDSRRRLDALFLLIFPLVLFVVSSFVIKLVEFEFLLGLSENFLCWKQTLFAMIVLPLDVNQPLTFLSHQYA
jgi:hypothetical protein